MKLTFSPASPFARKVRIAAIELGLIDKIELVPAAVAPGTANEEYQRISPLKKLPVLILGNGDVILDSYVIVEYLNELAGGSLIPDYGPTRWKVKSDHSLHAGHARCHAAVPLRGHGAPGGVALEGVVGRSLEPGLERHGAVRAARRRAERSASPSRRSASSACSAMPISASPIAAGARPIRSSTRSTRRCWNGRR